MADNIPETFKSGKTMATFYGGPMDGDQILLGNGRENDQVFAPHEDPEMYHMYIRTEEDLSSLAYAGPIRKPTTKKENDNND